MLIADAVSQNYYYEQTERILIVDDDVVFFLTLHALVADLDNVAFIT